MMTTTHVCERRRHTKTHKRDKADMAGSLKKRKGKEEKASVPGSSLAEIPSRWLVNKAGTAFPVVNKNFLSILTKRHVRERNGNTDGKDTNDTVTHRRGEGMQTGQG